MKIFKAFFDDFNIITLVARNSYFKNNKMEFKIYDLLNNEYIDTKVMGQLSEKDYTYVTLTFNHALNIGEKYYLIDGLQFREQIKYRMITQTRKFDRLFACDKTLGITYSKDETIFRLWAPTAFKVILNVEDHYYQMIKDEHGVYEYTVSGDLNNKKYSYLVDVNDSINETIDPYAYKSGPNASYSIVTDNKKIEKLHKVIKHDSIYEINVRDYSEKHSFESLKEKIDYLASLNVSTIQLMPILDFGSVDDYNPDLYYNWGYDPSQYFTFEGTYSDDPINDLKSLVQEFHNHKLNITLDVVFNHVFNIDTFSLNKIVPYYFFKYIDYPYLTLSKCSGCQNDFRSEGYMAYKLIKDSLTYLINYFDVDGFRLDLMGLLDLTCIKKLYRDLKLIKKDIIFYGEGWTMNKDMNGATITNAKEIKDISFFNDYYRDNVIELIKGDYSKWFYVLDVMKGNHALDFDNPLQSINYIECHDGYTFFDNVLRSDRKKHARKLCDLGMAFVTFSQGIPFFTEGQECYRSKNGHSNTYNMGDKINHVTSFEKNNILSKLMEIRHNFSDCFYSNYEDIKKYVNIVMNNDCIYYYNKYLTVILNYSLKNIDINLNGEVLLTTSKKEYLEPFTFIVMKGANDDE